MWTKKAWVLKQDAGDGKMKEISDYIYEGALAFLKAEYRLLAIFVVIASVVLAGITFSGGTSPLVSPGASPGHIKILSIESPQITKWGRIKNRSINNFMLPVH